MIPVHSKAALPFERMIFIKLLSRKRICADCRVRHPAGEKRPVKYSSGDAECATALWLYGY